MPESLSFDFEAVTPRMLVDFKKVTGESLMSFVGDTGFSMESMSEECIAGVVWLALRMSGQPDATYDDALDTPFSMLSDPDEEQPDPS